MLRYLFRPFAYIGIQHPGMLMMLLNWVVPVIASIALVLVMITFTPSINLFAIEGLLLRLLGFVQSLPGFYLAALAAVATFNQPNLDKLMPGQPPVARIVYNGVLTEVQLTRRRFLCLMFSYLTAISILLTLALVFSTTLAGPVRDALVSHQLECMVVWVRWTTAFGLMVGMVQMGIVTFYGLFYLGERIHTADT